MSDFKQWKDSENLTGVQYTRERNQIREKVLQTDTEFDKKSAVKFALSETPPDFEFTGQIWLNPNQFNTTRFFEKTISVVSNIEGFKSNADYFYFDETVTTDVSLEGFKIEQSPPIFISDDITVSLNLSGFKEEFKTFFLDETVTTDSTIVGYKEQVLYLPVNHTMNVDTSVVGFKEQILYIPVTTTVNTDVTPTGFKEQILYIPVTTTVTTNVSATGFKQEIDYYSVGYTSQVNASATGYKDQLKYLEVNDTVTTTVSATGFKEELKYLPINDTVTTSASASGYKEQLKFLSINDTITTSVSPTGYKAKLGFLPVNDIITTSVSATGFKPQALYESINDTITTSVSPTGFKSIEIYARSDAPFTTTFTFNGVGDSVSIPAASYEVVGTIGKDQTLGVTVPSSFIYNNVKYLYENTTFIIGGSSTGTRTETSFTLSIFGTTYLNFNYAPVEFIDVLAKAIDLDAGDQMSVDVNFETLNELSQVQYGSVETVEGQYAIKHQFENSPDYKIKIQAPTSVALGGSTYDYVEMEGYADGDETTGDFLFGTTNSTNTYTPNPTGIAPRVDETMYIKFNYDKQRTYTLRAGLTVSNDSTSPSRFLSTTLTRKFGTESPSTMTIVNTALGYTVVGTRLEGTTYEVSVPSTISNQNGFWTFDFWTITAGGSGNYSNPKTGTLNTNIDVRASYTRAGI